MDTARLLAAASEGRETEVAAVLLRLERHRLVLLGGGAPEAAAVIYGFGQPDLQPVFRRAQIDKPHQS